MLKQLNAGIVSLGLMSTMAAPVMAQDAFKESTEVNSVPTNSLLVEDYSNLYSSVPKIDGESNNLAVKNTLSFSDITVEESDTEEGDLVSQRSRRSRTGTQRYKYSAGFDFPINFGWIRDENGAIKSILGFNLGLGVGYRRYFKPAVPGKFNFSFHVGTVLVVFPVVGGGAEYMWEQGWFVGAYANIFPVFFFTDNFIFPVFPSISVGYRWK